MNYRFLIYISYRYSIPIGKPLEKEILKRGYTVKWFADEPETNQYFSNKTSVISNIKDVIKYDPHIILTSTNMVPDFISGLKVQVFHGFLAKKRPSKKHIFSEFRIRNFFDLYCTQGPSTSLVFTKLAEKHKHFNVIETGWSKMDSMFPFTPSIQNKIPTILIASTFTARLSLAHCDNLREEIIRLAQTNKYHFNLVLHPKMNLDVVKKWKNIQSTNFRYYDTTDLVPLYKDADILFADTTSAIQEFLLQKKTVVAFNHTFKHDYLIHVSEPKNIEAGFIEALKNPKQLTGKIEKFIQDLHPYFDGKSSERIIDSTINFLHEDKSHLENKPLDLIRKIKIRKKLGYYSLKSYRSPFTIKKEYFSSNTIAKISAVIITYNEEEHLEKCLASLVNVADEIIVVDSYSTDRTKKICEHFNVRFIEHKFEGYIEQKNYALSTATNDYILSLDGDEALSEELKSSIIKIKQNWTCDGYYSNRLNNYCGQWIKHSDWYPDKKLRLFKKGSGEWKGINPHDSYTLKKNKKEGKLKGDLLHWIYRDYKEHKQKVDNFSTIAAEAYFKLGIKSSIFKIFFRPSWAFFKSYFLRLGFLDGKNGFRICKQTFRVTYLKYKKLYKHWH